MVVFVHLYLGGDAAVVTGLAEDTAGFLKVSPEEVVMATGSPEEAADQIRSLWEAGARTVVVRPYGPDPLPQVDLLLGQLR